MTTRRPPTRLLPAGVAFALSAAASAQVAFVDAQGREWRQLADLTGRTWDQVAQVCPADGGACAGALGAADLTGWSWASREDVLALFAEFVPGIVNDGAVSGPDYTLAGLGFFGWFDPTFEFYTTFGGHFSLSGWSSTQSDGVAVAPQAAASYNPHNASFSVVSEAAADSASVYRGVWLFRAPKGCPADFDANGVLNFFDVDAFLGLYGDGHPDADLAAPAGVFDFFDVSAFLSAYDAGCP